MPKTKQKYTPIRTCSTGMEWCFILSVNQRLKWNDWNHQLKLFSSPGPLRETLVYSSMAVTLDVKNVQNF